MKLSDIVLEKIFHIIQGVLWGIAIGLFVLICRNPNVRFVPKYLGESPAPEFRICVAAFQQFTGITKNVPIKFAELNPAILGLSYLFPYPFTEYMSEIEINKSQWDSLGDGQCFLVWHELAHVLCHREHIEGEFKDGCATSIMNPYLPGNPCIYAHFNEYLKDFAQICRKQLTKYNKSYKIREKR